jgi:hypothetical protein
MAVLPNQRIKLSWPGGRLKGKGSPQGWILTMLLTRLWWRAIWRISSSRQLHMIRTAVWAGATNRDRCFDRVDEALDLIERYDPATLASLRRHFAGILVFGEERFRSAHWNQSARLCVITSLYLESPNISPERIALTLVHENTHATLLALGIPYLDGRRACIEVICAMAELAFARRMTLNPELIRRTERRIEDWSTSGEAPWSKQTHREEVLEQLREMGTPKWILSLLRRLAGVSAGRAA